MQFRSPSLLTLMSRLTVFCPKDILCFSALSWEETMHSHFVCNHSMNAANGCSAVWTRTVLKGSFPFRSTWNATTLWCKETIDPTNWDGSLSLLRSLLMSVSAQIFEEWFHCSAHLVQLTEADPADSRLAPWSSRAVNMQCVQPEVLTRLISDVDFPCCLAAPLASIKHGWILCASTRFSFITSPAGCTFPQTLHVFLQFILFCPNFVFVLQLTHCFPLGSQFPFVTEQLLAEEHGFSQCANKSRHIHFFICNA